MRKLSLIEKRAIRRNASPRCELSCVAVRAHMNKLTFYLESMYYASFRCMYTSSAEAVALTHPHVVWKNMRVLQLLRPCKLNIRKLQLF